MAQPRSRDGSAWGRACVRQGKTLPSSEGCGKTHHSRCEEGEESERRSEVELRKKRGEEEDVLVLCFFLTILL